MKLKTEVRTFVCGTEMIFMNNENLHNRKIYVKFNIFHVSQTIHSNFSVNFNTR